MSKVPTPPKARIIVVDDHAMVREGLVALINRTADLEVCGEADTAPAALALINRAKPDAVLVDLILKQGDGIELIKSARAQHRTLPMLVISMQDEELFAERALRAGASGYIMKYSAGQDLIDAIHKVLAGEVCISRKMSARLLRKFVDGAPPDRNSGALNQLTDREIEIYRMIGAGMSTGTIAEHLGISVRTVETHRENIKHKLCLQDGIALIQSATQWVQDKT